MDDDAIGREAGYLIRRSPSATGRRLKDARWALWRGWTRRRLRRWPAGTLRGEYDEKLEWLEAYVEEARLMRDTRDQIIGVSPRAAHALLGDRDRLERRMKRLGHYLWEIHLQLEAKGEPIQAEHRY